MKPDGILEYCLKNLEGSILVESWGEKGIFYNPGHVLKRGEYILTVKEKDGDNDKGSDLDRPGIYRVNMGVRKGTFIKLFEAVPKRPGAGGIVEMDYDFSAVDQILPHPVYAWALYSRKLRFAKFIARIYPRTPGYLENFFVRGYRYPSEYAGRSSLKNFMYAAISSLTFSPCR